jgi:autotransporter-associated beta strand protein
MAHPGDPEVNQGPPQTADQYTGISGKYRGMFWLKGALRSKMSVLFTLPLRTMKDGSLASRSLALALILLLPAFATAADKAWNSATAATWSAGPWDPAGAPGTTDNVVTPLQYSELRVDSDVTINDFTVIGFTTNWPLRASDSIGAKTLAVNGNMSVEAGDAAKNISFYNNGVDSPLNVVVNGDLTLTSDAEGGILQFGDRFGPGDFNDLTVNGTTNLVVLGSRAIALRLNANSASFNGGVVFNTPGSGPVQFTIANDETRPGNTSVAYLSGGDSQCYIQANETGTSTPTAPSAILNITGNSGTTYSFDGIIRDIKTAGNSATLGINKTGSNVQVLSGNNQYTGPTTVAGGTLLVNGNQAAATGPVTVASGATLGGTGTIGGAVTINGRLAPGTSIGTLAVQQTVTWNGGTGASAATDWPFELDTGSTSDRLSITGNFEKGTGTDFRFDFGGSAETGTFILVEWTGTTSFSPGDFTFTNLGGGNSAFFQMTGGQLEVVVTDTAGCTPPTELAMSGSGTFCTSDGARVFGVSGSTEPDVDYELRIDGTPVESLSGTGGTIDFSAQSLAGTYLVVGIRGACVTAMSGDAVIYDAATADAGPDQTVSPNQDIALAGAVGGTATGGIWSGGAGTFDPDSTALDATYTPTAGETGTGSLTLTLTTTGQASPCSEAVDTVEITFANVAPAADNQQVVVPTDTPTSITLTASDLDGDSLDFTVVDLPANGTLGGTAPDLVYTPDSGYQGEDSFTFKADDGLLDSNIATISLTVTDAPAIPGPQGKVYRFYFIGNSLTLGLTTANEGYRARFHGLFKDRGNIMHFGTQMGAGVNLDEHWMGIRTFDGSFMKQSYMDDQNEAQDPDGFAGPLPLANPSIFRDYNFALQGNEVEIDGTILNGRRFDALILQPYQSFIEENEYTPADQADPNGPFGDRLAINQFIDYATGNNPAGHAVTERFHIYSAWPRIAGIEGKALDNDSDGVYSFEEFYMRPL